MSKPRIVKTHTIVNEHISTCNTTIETVLDDLTDQPVFWICKRSDDSESTRGCSDPPRIKIRANARYNPSVAGVRFSYNGTRYDRSSFCAVVAKHPEEVPIRKWRKVQHTRLMPRRLGELFEDVFKCEQQWVFRVHGRLFVWKETHSARLGACRCHTSDLKLMDARGRVQAVYIDNHGRRRDTFGRVDYFVEMERETEVMSLAVILGIQERKNQLKREEVESAKTCTEFWHNNPLSVPQIWLSYG
ncbi:hypothetical protein TI39_contig4229g00013 [Zymoseptoria brevis]|uniref:Uncharacterized protein n=1 Tax=Zymoseptoria brevis TaxID=1047168 RepID=A0A0F4GCR5_9PEZI|nr:hypothetical protein TI39_contig4229g00013 [Zymoseptoria brevis]